MKLRRLMYRRMRHSLAEAYSVAYESYDAADVIYICLETADGLRGYGAAAPDPAVTGETIEQTEAALEKMKSSLADVDLGDSAEALLGLAQEYLASPAARAAVDIALHDLYARRCGEPLWKTLGGTLHPVPIMATIGILPLEETLTRARDWLQRGFAFLKIKGGNDVEDDIRRVCALRDELGDSVRLCFDANQGYTSEEATRFVSEIAGTGIEFVEQPLPAGEWALMDELVQQSAIPIMADESCVDASDVERLLSETSIRLFNIKLMKCGGIAPAREMIRCGAKAGARFMLGCMDEPALSIAAALAIALSDEAVVYTDLDGHIGLQSDPSTGALTLEKGCLIPSGKPGLGFDGASFFE